MRKLLLVATIMFATAVVSQAQPQRGEGRKGYDVEQIQKELQLTEKQTADLKKINAEHRDKMQAMRNENKKSQEEMKKMQEGHQKSIKAVLTDEQYIKYLEKRTDRKKGEGKEKGKRK